MRSHVIAVAVSAALAACASFPEIDALGEDTGPPPQLEPIDGLLAQADAAAQDPAPDLQARAARLRARAAAIKAGAPPP
ncbi:hypothetical protein [Tabrizicola sp.]|uniref:hypothetical protein n=1 Tax=Tabrizicola sp. TaxID=2005166 RepID=UPI003F3FB8AE